MPDNNLFFALSNASPGRDDAFNEWYDRHHIREVPEFYLGFMIGRRYRLAPVQRTGDRAGTPCPWEYLAIYQLDPAIAVADVHASVASLPERTVPAGDTLSPDHVAWTWQPIGPRVVASGATAAPGTQQHVLLVLTNPTAGRDDEFNAWYDTRHLPEAVQRIPGRVAGQRYRLTEAQRPDQWDAAVPGRPARGGEPRDGQWLPWTYLALYELEGDDVAELQASDTAVRAAGELSPAGELIDPSFAVWLFSALPDPGWEAPAPRSAAAGVIAT